jgi:uncharacterized membrane protein
MSGEWIVCITFVATSGLLVGLGIPLLKDLVPPNWIYGFRTSRTLRDPRAWYLANRVCGYWCIATGLLTAAVSIGTCVAGLTLPASAFLPVAALLTGVIAVVIHGEIASRQAGREDSVASQFGPQDSTSRR